MQLPLHLMKLPVNMMVAGVNTVSDSMQEIQRTAKRAAESGATTEGDGADSSKLRNVSKSALMPYAELLKLPQSVFASSMKALGDTMQEIRDQSAATARAENGKAVGEPASEVVALTPEEAALEVEALLSEGYEDCETEILWQIGRAGRADHDAEWTEVFDYQVGEDLDPIDSPCLPHLLMVSGGPKRRGAAETWNIRFKLDRDYPEGELALIYDRWGAEKDRVLVDGELLSPVRGAGKGKFRHVALALNALSAGEHVITLTTSGQTESGGHRIDYLKLVDFIEPCEPTEED